MLLLYCIIKHSFDLFNFFNRILLNNNTFCPHCVATVPLILLFCDPGTGTKPAPSRPWLEPQRMSPASHTPPRSRLEWTRHATFISRSAF
jgi:hypothetical protein